MKNKYIYEFVFWDPIKTHYRIWVYTKHFKNATGKELVRRVNAWPFELQHWLNKTANMSDVEELESVRPAVEDAVNFLGDVTALKLRRVNVTTPDGNKKELFLPTTNIAADSQGYFGFVHPTKTGGSTIERHLFNNYSDYIVGEGHGNTAASVLASGKIPIIPIRHPYGRFHSMYTYWRNGASSGSFLRPENWKPVVKTASQFLLKWQNKNSELLAQMKVGFTWDIHFASYKEWFTKKEWDKAVVLIYHPSKLSGNFSLLLENLGISPVARKLPVINPSAAKEDLNLTKEANEILRKKFAYDFELWEDLKNHPHKFKKVIGHFPS
jgi:hypothetical protein